VTESAAFVAMRLTGRRFEAAGMPDSDKSSFQLATFERVSRSITCSFNRELFDTVIRYLRPPGDEGVPIRVEGFVTFDPLDRPIAVPYVSGSRPLTPKRGTARKTCSRIPLEASTTHSY
jgi:hypothetical protein